MTGAGGAPCVALITDFGLVDGYVCEMHAVLYAMCPTVRVLDITHGIPAGDVKSAAYILQRTSRRLPAGAIFVAVVDPGVGTDRQAVLLDCMDRYFIGPDNGLFSRVIMDEEYSARIIDWSDVGSKPGSAVFQGRDLFAPAAGKLAGGYDSSEIGRPGELLDTPPAGKPYRKDGGWVGEVVYIDRFGNVVTDLPNGLSGRISLRNRHGIAVARNYADQPQGGLFWLEGSGGYIEISMNQSSAADLLGVEIGDAVEIEEDRN